MTKRGYLKRRELARQAARTLTVVPDPWTSLGSSGRQTAKPFNFGLSMQSAQPSGLVVQVQADFSALEQRILGALKVPSEVLVKSAPGTAAQLGAIAEAMRTSVDDVAEQLAEKVREEYLRDPSPEEEAAQRLTGTYLTRKEKKARLFGGLYGTRTGRMSASQPNLANIPRHSKGTL
jgi:hypothetical protein